MTLTDNVKTRTCSISRKSDAGNCTFIEDDIHDDAGKADVLLQNQVIPHLLPMFSSSMLNNSPISQHAATTVALPASADNSPYTYGNYGL